jgi:ATP-dependent Clp protease protease subunit
MVHEPRIMGHGITGRATDIEIEAIELKKTKETLTSILAKHSNKTYEEMWEICKLDTWLTPQEALEYGLIDEVIKNKDRSKLKWKPENS